MIFDVDTGIDIWRLAAGLGLFLFGMHELEQALRLLTGRPFKKFLRDHTGHPVKGVIAGAVTTAALQSSSVVSLIVLAFVGTGVISLSTAVGIVFGSNLGTTATGWIVATIGFRLDIEALALPLVAIGGLGVVWTRPGTKRAGTGHLLAGLGLMLMGLDFMKSGAISATGLFDPQALAAYPPVVFLVAGLLVTSVIQSSSATIMITLSALHAGAVTLESAAAVAIGADLGTTITAVLGALAGSADKRRVAAAIVVFNVVTDALAFLALGPLLSLVTTVAGIADPLYALVAFHSLFNLAGILIFLPLIGPLSRWLSMRFVGTDGSILRHIRDSDLAVPEAAVANAGMETLRLIDQAAALNRLSFRLPVADTFYDVGHDRDGVPLFGLYPDHDAAYDGIKQLEGEILGYAIRLQAVRLDTEESERLRQIIVAIRSAVHSAKSLRDTHHDLESFRESLDDHYNAWLGRFQDAAREFYDLLSGLRTASSPAHRFELLVQLKSKNETLHTGLHAAVHADVSLRKLSRTQASTILNVNRELYLSNQSLLAALADALLDAHRADDFDAIPVGA